MSAIKQIHTLALYLHLLNMDFHAKNWTACVLWNVFRKCIKPISTPLHSIYFTNFLVSNGSKTFIYFWCKRINPTLYDSNTLPIAEPAIRRNNKWDAAYRKLYMSYVVEFSVTITAVARLWLPCSHNVRTRRFAHGRHVFRSCVYFDGAIRAQYSSTMPPCSLWKCRTIPLDFYGL